jgi:hypothetical protein
MTSSAAQVFATFPVIGKLTQFVALGVVQLGLAAASVRVRAVARTVIRVRCRAFARRGDVEAWRRTEPELLPAVAVVPEVVTLTLAAVVPADTDGVEVGTETDATDVFT